MTTHTLESAEADIVYDVLGPLPTTDGRPPLFMIGQPMTASGFTTLASYFPDRTVVTYDPRGLGRSTRKDGRVDNMPTLQARDYPSVCSSTVVLRLVPLSSRYSRRSVIDNVTVLRRSIAATAAAMKSRSKL